MKKVAIFLDRDGVINYERKNYITSVSEFEFIPGALDALRLLSKLDSVVVVLTNQSVVGRGIINVRELGEIHRFMVDKIASVGGRVDAVLYCPHTPEARCGCRKPSTGLFRQAAKRFDIFLSRSWFIGDKSTDKEAGESVGCRTIIIPSNTDHALLRAVRELMGAIQGEEGPSIALTRRHGRSSTGV